MKKLFFIAYGVSILLASGEPRWFAMGELYQYSVKYNYVGVGEGVTFSGAQSAAQTAIAAQLEVTVASTIETYTKAIETENSSYFRDVFEQSILSTINLSVKGIEVVKKEKLKGKYYVFAVLNKRRYMNSLKVELDQLWTTISAYVLDAREFTRQGRIFPALENYMDVQGFIPSFYSKKAFYDALSTIPYRIYVDRITTSQSSGFSSGLPIPGFEFESDANTTTPIVRESSAPQDITMGNVLTEMRDILSGVKIKTVSGNKQSALVGGGITQSSRVQRLSQAQRKK